MSTENQLSYTKCNLCGSNNADLIIDLRRSKDSRVRQYRIVQCKQCGLIYLNPRPSKEKMASFYPENYLPFKKASIEEEDSSLLKWARRQKYNKMSRTIKAFFKDEPGALLDVGCSTGLFLNHMAQKGWIVTGVEPNFQAAQYAKNRFGLNVINDTIESASLPETAFDVITYWDVMEHVYDPMAVFSKTNQLLKDNGLLLINFPPAESFARHKFKDNWIGYDPPRHLYVFSRETMKAYLVRNGFEILRWANVLSPFFAYVISLNKYHSDNDAGLRKLTEKIINIPGMRFIFEPFFYYNFLIGKADLLTVIARKSRLDESK